MNYKPNWARYNIDPDYRPKTITQSGRGRDHNPNTKSQSVLSYSLDERRFAAFGNSVPLTATFCTADVHFSKTLAVVGGLCSVESSIFSWDIDLTISMENQNALKMQEGDTLAYNLSGESVRALWAKIDLKKSK